MRTCTPIARSADYLLLDLLDYHEALAPSPAAAAALAAQPAKRPRASQQGRAPNGHGGCAGAGASADAAEERGTAPPVVRGSGALLLLAPAPVPHGTLSAELLECEAQPGAEFRHEFSGHERGVLLLEATPYAAPGARAGGGTLACSRRAEPIWAAALASPAVLLTGNARFAAAACADGSLHVFTPAGRRALPAVRACAAPAALHADAEHSLLLVGADGTVVVWRHLPHAPECVLRCSAAPLLASGETPLLQASLAADGGPLLHLPTGCFAYQPRMQAWLCPADMHTCTWTGVGRGSTQPTPRAHSRTTHTPHHAPRHCATHMDCGVQAWLNLADTDFVGSAYASSLPLATGAAQAAALARLQQQQAAACRSAAASGDGASVAAARLAMQLGALPPANPNPKQT